MANEITKQRDIQVVTDEIRNICAQARHMMLVYAVEIGRRLKEAKEILPHGAWGDWLKNEVEFSQSTANKHMQLYEAYGNQQLSLFGAELNSETFTNLSYSAALKLLAVPDEEREQFVKDNDIENKSVREIDQLIKERDEARAEADDVKIQLAELRTEADEANNRADAQTEAASKLREEKAELAAKLEKARASEKKSKDKLKELQKNPQIPQEKIDALRADIEKENAENNAAEIEKQLADIKKKLAAAEESEIKARREAEITAGRVQELEKQVKIADPAVAEFRSLFKHIQDYIIEAKTALGNIKDKSTADKFKGALKALAQSLEE